MFEHGAAGPRPGLEAARWWARMARDPMRTYGELARHYGDAVRVPFGVRRSFFLLSRPEHAERILVANQDNYVKAFTYRPLRAVLGDGLLTSEGETWRRHRRQVQPVFAHRHVAGFAPRMVESAADAVRRWPDGAKLDAADELRRLTLDIVGRAFFGSELAKESGRTGRSLAVLQRGAVIGTFLPGATARRDVYRRVPRLGGALAQLESLVQRVVEEPSGGGELLNLIRESGEFDEAELRDEVLTLLLAGHETTAASLAWTFVLLSRYPAARERLEAEVDEVLGGREPKAEDVDALPWTKAVLSEAMRLHPPAWTIERDSLDDDVVAGVEIPARSTVAVPPYLLHRNPDVWPNPEGFQPERFLGERNRHRYAYLPFGGGRRICVGAGFAMLEATLVLATISRTHRLDLVPGAAVPGRAEITFRPAGPVPMKVIRR
ncbi:cytochrome P450 [Actinomadura decatromicini]|uniref:Cytochrome P450 n=1 Tax=Actinomadura decatromicini TaxID=2604572 RepID=A0A5D3F7Y6_9ACTN|nr:cytochrome P450 [Actinomadura decatromicini]TYK43830.1 cytochrome P450 [Actinomadura decatromicini]